MARAGLRNLAHAVSQDRTGCDPAYPDERTCIAPGRPLAEPCSITDQRNFTVLPRTPGDWTPTVMALAASRFRPVVERSSAAPARISTSGGYLPRRPRQNRRVAVAAAAVAPQLWRAGARLPRGAAATAGWCSRDGNRAGLWFMAPARTSTGSVAIVSNPVFISQWTVELAEPVRPR